MNHRTYDYHRDDQKKVNKIFRRVSLPKCAAERCVLSLSLSPTQSLALVTRYSHLMTLSARARTLGGIVRPICFAVFKLITSSNFVGCSTGRSAGFAPLDRKSTRLNSSHMSISYAVFCLKKKINKKCHIVACSGERPIL